MIKLQVLRYMGILTIMKFSVFAVSALSLLLALSWFLIYCPTVPKNVQTNSNMNVHTPRDKDMSNEDYFDLVEKNMLNDLNNEKIKESNEKSSKNLEKTETSSKDGNIIPEKRFNDQAFERLIEELNNKNIDGYEFMAESTNVTIYRKPSGNAGLFQYKLYAILPHASPEQITGVFLDNEYRLVWDGYVTGLYYVKKAETGPDILYFNVDYPWPLANRDYVYAREGRKLTRNGKEYVTLVMHSVLKDTIPQESGVIRVDDYHQSVVMTKLGPHGSHAYIEYYDDPKGSVPSWLVNWAAKTGVPAFLSDLQRACAGLDKFLKDKNRPMKTLPPHTK